MALLISLDALLRDRGVSAAARRLGISQPAMSAQLAKLRTLFDDPILVAEGASMVPTARAAALERPLHEALAEVHRVAFEPEVFDPSRATRVFRIAATDYAHAVVLPPLLAQLRADAPGIRISALPFPEQDLRRRLGDDLDCAIASERMMDQDLPSLRLFEDTFRLVFRQGHPQAAQAMDLDLFCDLEHLLVSPSGGGFTGAVDQALSAMGRQRRVVASLPNFLLALASLRRSDCVAVLPSRVAALESSGLTALDPPVPLGGFTTVLGWHPRMGRDPGHRWLRRLIAAQTRTQ